MCNPAAALAGISGVSAVVGFSSQRRAANDQERYQRNVRNQQEEYNEEVRQYQNRVFEETRSSSNANFLSQAAQVNLRIRQESEAVQQQSQFIEQERAQASSSAAVSAAASGISGNTVDALLQDFSRSAAMQAGTAERNLSLFRRQSAEEIRGLRAQARNRTVSALPTPIAPPGISAPVQRPSTLGLLTSIAGSAYGASQGYQVPQQAPSAVQSRTPVFFNQQPRGTARF